MKRVRAFFMRVTAVFNKNFRERELQDEFQCHLQLHIDDNVRSGMSPEQARREALLKFGGLETAKESVRENSRALWIETTLQDLHYAFRGLRLNPAFAATAILSLALGVGASVAIFTVADNLLLRPLPYPQASQLVMVYEVNQRRNFDHNVVSPGNYFDWKAQNSVFEDIGGFIDYHGIFSDGKRSEELDCQSVTGELLPLLKVAPVRGRLFTHEEDLADARVALISYRVWQSWFGGDETILGRQIQFNSNPFTVVGVLPPNFYFHSRTVDIWLPLGLRPSENFRKTQGRWMWTVARMKPGVTLRQAQSQMSTIAQRLELVYPDFNKTWGVNVEPLRDALVGEVKTSLLILLGAVALLLAVACANVANLLLARYSARRREMAVRGALGAVRGRLIRQLLTESLVLGAIGGALGIVLARFAVVGLVALAPKALTASIEVAFDARIVLIAFGLSLLTGIIFGLAPALIVSRPDINQALHEDSRSSTGSGGLRNWLVAAEIGCAVALLAGAGLLFRSLVGLQHVDPGLNAANLLTFRVSVPRTRYSDITHRIQFFSHAADQMAQLPGVTSASAVSYLPFNGLAAGTKVEIEGRPPAKAGEDLVTVVRTVLPGYFRTMGIPLKSGRDFTPADNVEASPYRFVINEAFARKYLPGQEPLEHRISVWMDDKNPFGDIIGVVGDVKEGTLEKNPEPTAYYVHAHLAYSTMVFVMRTQDDPLNTAGPAQRIIQGLDREQPVGDIRTMETVLSNTFSRQQFSAVLLFVFSLASLVLAAIGIYGVLSYSVSQRTREIGVRMALGAERSSIVRMVVMSAARFVLAGTAAGIAVALALSSGLKSLLFGIGPRDPLTFMVAPGILLIVALFAAYLPARRAARVSPMEALRID